jgi:hypothetical protein
MRQGSCFPDWLLQRRKRAERALTSVVATCYLLGVSTRRMERLVETLGVTSLSKSQVSIMAKELDEAVEAFRTRLSWGPGRRVTRCVATGSVSDGVLGPRADQVVRPEHLVEAAQ